MGIIEEGEQYEGNEGAWFNKNDHRDMRLVFDPQGQPPEGYTRAEPLHGVGYQIYDEASGKWAADPDAGRLAEMAACKAGLEAIDREAGAGRAVRALAINFGEKAGMSTDPDDLNYNEDYEKLLLQETHARMLREQLDGL
jgi:hypothetical protein